MQLLEKISQSMEQLSKSNRKIAQAILNSPEEIALYSLRDFSESIGLSTTSVIRFAKLFGYEGYSELRNAVRKHLTWRSGGWGRIYTLAQTKTTDDLLVKSFSTDMANLEETLGYLQGKKELLKKIVDLLMTSETLYILALRESFPLAHYAWSRFAHIRKKVHVIGAMGNIYEDDLVNVTAQDAVLVFSFPVYTRDTIYLLDKLHQQKVPISIVTSNQYEPMSKYSELIMPSGFHSISHKTNTIGAYAIINYLAVIAATEHYDRCKHHLNEIYEINTDNPTILELP